MSAQTGTDKNVYATRYRMPAPNSEQLQIIITAHKTRQVPARGGTEQ